VANAARVVDSEEALTRTQLYASADVVRCLHGLVHVFIFFIFLGRKRHVRHTSEAPTDGSTLSLKGASVSFSGGVLIVD
jgi:hypothetical protein